MAGRRLDAAKDPTSRLFIGPGVAGSARRSCLLRASYSLADGADLQQVFSAGAQIASVVTGGDPADAPARRA